jgi:hypothetical protein
MKQGLTLRRAVIVVVLTLLALIAWNVAWEKADAGAVSANAVCVTDSGGACKTPKQYATGFRQGELHNSRRFAFPPRIKRMIRSKARLAGDHWWDDPFKAGQCIFWGRDTSTCVTHNIGTKKIKRFDATMQSTVKLGVRCSGNAVIGYVGGSKLADAKGGWWGAGTGAAGCLYSEILNKWFS